MIERVAQWLSDFDLDGAHSDYEKELHRAARAAIAAMREPTSEMCTAGHVAMENFTTQIEHRAITPIIWHAMIDAALRKEKEPE
jgi:hypothetical protein